MLSEIARTARTPRDPRSVDRHKSARVAELRARVAERAKDAEREKAEVEHVLLKWLAELLAGGSKKSVSLEKRGIYVLQGVGGVSWKGAGARREEQATRLLQRVEKTAPAATKQCKFAAGEGG